MEYDFERFIKAQKGIYDTALKEIKNGHKETHWIWYIFPQHGALGRSDKSKYYGINSLEEAAAYLAHPVLGPRLKKICEALLLLDTDSPYRVMGGIDAKKLRSSMTLFAEADSYDSVFGKVLDKYYNGKKDDDTVKLLKNQN